MRDVGRLLTDIVGECRGMYSILRPKQMPLHRLEFILDGVLLSPFPYSETQKKHGKPKNAHTDVAVDLSLVTRKIFNELVEYASKYILQTKLGVNYF
jgi:hypothetical protein